MTERITSIDQTNFTPGGEVFPSPRDWRDVFIYFLLVDRFDNNQEDVSRYDPKQCPVGKTGSSIGPTCVAYSRILDTTEILITLNLDANPRNDFVTVDAQLTPVGRRMINLLDPAKQSIVEGNGLRHAERVPLDSHEIGVYKLE